MLRTVSGFVAVIFAATAAYGQQGQVFSYYMEVSAGPPFVLIPDVPPQGIVITDVTLAPGLGSNWEVLLYERQTNDVLKTRLLFFSPNVWSYNFSSGIALAGGSSLLLELANNSAKITVSGYIPSAGNAPAVSQWGLAIMGLLILTAGTLAVMRRRQHAA